MRRALFLFLLVLTLFLTACGADQPTPTPALVATDTPLPTLTPIPAKPLAILVVPADFPETQSEQFQELIYSLAQAEGYRFQVLNTLTSADLDSSVKIVVVFPPDPGIASLAAEAPQAQFLAVGVPGLTAGGNVSVLGGASAGADLVPFEAGYIASMLAQDFRIGMIEEKISDESSVAARAFDSAHTFYCGLCQPVAPPWYDYPVVASVPADTDKNLLSSYADALRDYQVSVAYISPEVSDPALINYMASNGMLMIGEVTPPDAARSSWVVSIQPNWLAAVEAAWPQLVAGNGGLELPSPITLTDINPDLLSSGKQRLAQQMLDDLLAGKVSTGAQP